MLNYSNLSDVEFENLCQDVMSSILGTKLHKFAPGRDGGIDLRNDSRDIIVQVKHYMNSSVDQLLASLKKEVPKVAELNPKNIMFVAQENSALKKLMKSTIFFQIICHQLRIL